MVNENDEGSVVRAISGLCTAGIVDVSEAMQMALVQISRLPPGMDCFSLMDGDLSRELRDLVHHIINGISDPNVDTWTQDVPEDERVGLKRLVAFAREHGYRTDDLPSAST